jgi:hypothetical protein
VAAACGWAGPAWAAWGVSLDAPLRYIFDDPHVTTKNASSSNSPPTWKDVEGSPVDGVLLAVSTPLALFDLLHLGVGYDAYSVKAALLAGNCTSDCDVTINFDFEVFNLLLDIPTRFANFGVGYGMGSLATKVKVPSSANGVSVRNADVTQLVMSVGAVFGRFDIHLGYRIVSVEKVPIEDKNSGQVNNNPDHLAASGRLLSLGARMNF